MTEANDNKQFDDRFFFEDKFSNRIMLWINERDEDTVAYNSPAIPALDAPLVLFSLFYDPVGGFSEQVAGTLRPSIKKWLEISSKFDREYFKVPAEFVNSPIAGLAYDPEDPESVSNFYQSILGGSITPIQGTPAEGAINGWVYPLDEKQRVRLKKLVSVIGDTTGLISMNGTYYKMFSGEGTAYEEMPMAAVPFITPMTLTEKQKIEYYNLMSRQQALEDELRQKKGQLRNARGE